MTAPVLDSWSMTDTQGSEATPPTGTLSSETKTTETKTAADEFQERAGEMGRWILGALGEWSELRENPEWDFAPDEGYEGYSEQYISGPREYRLAFRRGKHGTRTVVAVEDASGTPIGTVRIEFRRPV